MSNDSVRSPDGSGYSAEPEPSCTVSAVPVSIPNALGLIDGEPCRVCGGGGWVCEDHADRNFEDCCGGAGMPCGACALEMACAGFTNREYRRAEVLLKALAETREMLGMAIVYMESVQHDHDAGVPWHHWADDSDGLEGFRLVHDAAIAMEARRAETQKSGSVAKP